MINVITFYVKNIDESKQLKYILIHISMVCTLGTIDKLLTYIVSQINVIYGVLALV